MTLRRLLALLRDRRGTALIEFAIALPVLLILFVGAYQLSDAIACKRKVTIMTRAVGDITSQNRSISTADLDALLAASTSIVAPYAADKARLRVTQITIESSGQVFQVNWSRGYNASALPAGRYYASALPAAYRQPNMVFVLAQSAYSYDSLLTQYFDSIDFAETIWLLPRKSGSIQLT